MNDYPAWIVSPTAEYCQAPGCRLKDTDGARYASPGSDLCNWHHTHFARTLIDLARLWPDLERALYRKSAGEQNTAVQTSGVSDLSQSWNPHVTEVLGQVKDWTQFLVRVILLERPLPHIEVTEVEGGRSYVERSHGIRTDLPTPVQLAAIARHHARWLSGYPFLGPHLLTDADALRMDAMRAINSDPVRRVGIKGATCGHVVDQVTDSITLTCMAPMVAILRPDGRPSMMVCALHPKSHRQYTAAEFMEWA